MNDGVPHLAFDSAKLPAGTAFSAWAALTPSYEASLLDGFTADDFTMNASAWLVGTLTVTSGQLSPIRLTRSEAHIGRDKRDNYCFLLLAKGEWRADFAGDGLDIGAGQICVIDFAHSWSAECTQNDYVMIVVPRQAVVAACPDAPPLHGRILNSATGRMLSEHFLSLARFLPSLDARDAALVENATLNLLTTAINSLPPVTDSVDESAFGATGKVKNIRAFIDHNLTNPALSVAFICKNLGISRPALYRSFSVSGGISAYVQRRRLESAHMRIADGACEQSLAEIAETFCFASQAHFSTAFRRCFGYPPREARAGNAPVEQAVNAQFHHWTQWLARNAQ